MRRLNDIKKVADFIVSNFRSDEFEFNKVEENLLYVIVPSLPSNIVSLVSSDIRIGVFPYDYNKILVNIYKL